MIRLSDYLMKIATFHLEHVLPMTESIEQLLTHCDNLIETASQSAKNALRERDFIRHEKEVDLIQQTAALEEQLRKYRGELTLVTLYNDWLHLRPVSYIWRGEKTTIETWKDMYIQIATQLYQENEQSFEQYTITDAAYSKQKEAVRGLVAIGPYFVKTYNSTQTIRRLIKDLFIHFDEDPMQLLIFIDPNK